MSYTPAQMATQYLDVAKKKAERPAASLLALSILAGMYVALAAFGAHMASVLLSPPGTASLVAALLFPAGLAMILVAGGELFTGNCLMVLGARFKRCTVTRMLRCWGIVYAGNFAGAALVAWLSALAMPSTAFAEVAVRAAQAKAVLPFGQAFLRGILCNVLVCVAVWMSYSTDSSTGKIVCMYFPVMLFVLCGTEHCVANMYYFVTAFVVGGAETLTLKGFLLDNLLPVTLGNLVGGSVVFSGLLWAALFSPKVEKGA